MPRSRRAVTFSLSPEMDEQVRQFIEEEDRPAMNREDASMNQPLRRSQFPHAFKSEVGVITKPAGW